MFSSQQNGKKSNLQMLRTTLGCKSYRENSEEIMLNIKGSLTVLVGVCVIVL